MTDSSEQRNECLNYAFRVLAELSKRWHNKLSFDDLRLPERYTESALRCHIHIRPFDMRADTGHFYAIFQRERLAPDCLKRAVGQARASLGDDHSRHERSNWYYHVMFVCDVDLVEAPEGRIPSLVRLQPPDDCGRLFTGSLYFSMELGFKTLGAFRDRKRSVAGCRAAVCEHELLDEDIQGRAHVMDGIASDRSPPGWWVFPGP